MIYRVFPLLAAAEPDEPGSWLHVPRERQGSGRHDNPDLYGAFYASRSAVSAVAERLQVFRGQTIGSEDLRRVDGATDALASIEEQVELVDLDDPRELVASGLRPSAVATRRRAVTRPLAAAVFAQGHAGLAWWSVLEASWLNVTLFYERAAGGLALDSDPEPLTVHHAVVREAADALGIRLNGA